MTDVLDTPLTGKYEMYPKGGCTIEELKTTGDSKFTIGLGEYSTNTACVALDNKCKVKFEITDIPIGLESNRPFCNCVKQTR